MKTIIHVNRHIIAENIKRPADKLLPIYTVKSKGKNLYGYSVKISGPCELVDIRHADMLSCGARAWISTESEVEIIDSMTWDQLQTMKALDDVAPE